MFRYIHTNHSHKGVRLAVALVVLLLAVAAVFAAEPSTVSDTTKEVIAYVVGGFGALSIVLNVIWSFFNRKNYDKLKETISDQEDIIDAKDRRNTELLLRISEIEAQRDLKYKENEQTIVGLKVSNGAVTRENLQMRAILKKLRLEGKWEGDEENVFKGWV